MTPETPTSYKPPDLAQYRQIWPATMETSTSFLQHLPPITSQPPLPKDDTNRLPVALAFYLSQRGDHRDQSLEEIISFHDSSLEIYTDWIKWLFPLPEGRILNHNLPLINSTVAAFFRRDANLRAKLRENFDRMMKAFGFKWDCTFCPIIQETVSGLHVTSKFSYTARYWWKPLNHNHLRFVRIIRSLRILGLPEEAEEFYKALVRACLSMPGEDGPSAASQLFWRRAARRPLWIKPETELEEEIEVDMEVEVEWGEWNEDDGMEVSGPDKMELDMAEEDEMNEDDGMEVSGPVEMGRKRTGEGEQTGRGEKRRRILAVSQATE